MTSFTDPIPADGRLILAVRRKLEHIRQAELLARVARDTGGNVAAERQRHIDARHDRFEFPNPVDLRGIPAIGRGVGGCIPGTRPDAITDRD